MSTMHTAQQASRVVRIAALSFALSFLPALAVVQQLVDPPAATEDVRQVMRCGAAPCDREMSSAATALVDRLTGQGLVCGSAPRLTDVVVVEWMTGEAEVVVFDRALEVAAHRVGWLRSYCVEDVAGR
ncbi:hypothetical protein [Aeromicrobium sp. 50.2.37]|uniref:hypothetical protein n=1 Tax=Aeromicrobium sp. 50.2.37 TaxID=2969305 RepID=UPI00214FF013|nr:hypothetical protein [Aeromicrobium sp. 50.2.37]MCR4514833.1 hypothetical protein [Aeromicrobium sp. 50.2.37]